MAVSSLAKYKSPVSPVLLSDNTTEQLILRSVLVKSGRGLSKGDMMRMLGRNLADFNGQIGAMFRLWALKSLNSEIKY